MNLLDKIKHAILGDNNTAGDDDVNIPSTFLTRQELLDAIFKHFKMRLAEETTDEGLLFATSYYIYMNEDDYNKRLQGFGHTVQEVVNKFHRFLREKKKAYPDYTPHASFWQFRFIPFKEGNLIEDESNDITQLGVKDVFILSHIHPTLSPSEMAAPSAERVVATVHTKDSMGMSNLAINLRALKGVDVLAKDSFRVSFNGFEQVTEIPLSDAQAAAPQNSARAIIKVMQSKFIVGDRKESGIYMQGDYLQISGRNDVAMRGGMQVARLDTEAVMNPHLILKWENTNRRMLLQAIGDVTLNEVALNPSRDKWETVPNKSAILINGEIQLTVTFTNN